jgi:hypothetical protein
VLEVVNSIKEINLMRRNRFNLTTQLRKLSKFLYPFIFITHFYSEHLNVLVPLFLNLLLVAEFLFVIVTSEPVQGLKSLAGPMPFSF